MRIKLPPQISKLLVGIGNPGNQYSETRHNVGKKYINYLIKSMNTTIQPSKFGNFTYILQNKVGIVLFGTESFMNESGRAVKYLFDILPKYNEPQLIVFHDDLDENLGIIKIKEGGSAEGHNGLKSIIQSTGNKDFTRVKIGIGRPDSKDSEVISNYVLGRFSNTEREILDKSFINCTNLLKNKGIL